MSTRSNYFTSHPESCPLTYIPLTPVVIPHDPSSSSTTSTQTTTTLQPCPAADSAPPPTPTPLRRPRRPRPGRHGRQLSITVPPPSRTLQSLVVPVQPASSSACLRSPFVLRGATRSASSRARAVAGAVAGAGAGAGGRGGKAERSVWEGFGSGSGTGSGAGQSERDPGLWFRLGMVLGFGRMGVAERGAHDDLERMPTSASMAYRYAARRAGGRPPAIVLAVVASAVFILVTFALVAPDAIKEALKTHAVKLWNHLCFNDSRGIVIKAQGEAPSPEDVKAFMDKW